MAEDLTSMRTCPSPSGGSSTFSQTSDSGGPYPCPLHASMGGMLPLLAFHVDADLVVEGGAYHRGEFPVGVDVPHRGHDEPLVRKRRGPRHVGASDGDGGRRPARATGDRRIAVKNGRIDG